MATIVPITDLTQGTLTGTGIFDILMRANKEHLEAEYTKNRIKGSEYSTVYLGSLEPVMRTAMEFLLSRQKIALEAELMAQQVLIAQAEVQKANAQVQIAQAEILKTNAEVLIANAQVEKIAKEIEILTLTAQKIPAEIAHLNAQTELISQQKINLIAEAANIPKQGLLIDTQAAVQGQQKLNLESEKLGIIAKTALTTQQTTNAVTENAVLQATKCKLDAEFDLLKENTLKAGQESALLAQKTVTEKAQVSGVGVDDNSVVGRQKLLYKAQTDGFSRDAEQKAAKLMVDVWNVQRTTDEGIAPSGSLVNGNIDRAVNKMLSGVGA